MAFNCLPTSHRWNNGFSDCPNGNWYYRDWKGNSYDANAAERQMKRLECCSSHYKMTCHACQKPIQRGDQITQVAESTGMELRYRGADSRDNILPHETRFYMVCVGENKWVHRDCVPCEFECGRLMGIWTHWSARHEAETPPQPHAFTYMADRVSRMVARIQARWRGHMCREKLKEMERDAQADRIRIQIKEITSTPDYDLCPDLTIRLQKLRQKLRDLEGVDKMITKYLGSRVFNRWVRILFDRGRPSQKIYSGVIISTRRRLQIQVFTVLYSDGDRLSYTAARLKRLLEERHYFECEEADELSVIM